MSGRFDRRLDEGLDRVVAGERAEVAAGINWSMAELEELLSAAAWLHSLPQTPAPANARGQTRERFLERGGRKRRAWVDDQARGGGLLPDGWHNPLDRHLDEALDRLHGGVLPEHAVGVNWVMAEVEDLFGAATLIHSLPAPAPRHAARVRSKNLFAAEVQRRRAGWHEKHFRPGLADSRYSLLGGRVTRLLDRAIDKILAGENPLGGRRATAAEAEARDLAEAALMLRMLPTPDAGGEARMRTRSVFMAQAAQRRVAWVHNHELRVPVPRRRQVRRHGFGGAVLLFVMAVVAVVLGVTTAALAGMSEPDSALYPLKRAGEEALFQLSPDNVSRADLQVQLAQQRMREAEAMAVRSKPELALEAVHDRYAALRAGAMELTSQPVHDKRWSRTRDRLFDEEGKPSTPIEQALNRNSFGDAATAVKQEAEQFQKERADLDRALGKAQPSPASTATPVTP